MQQANTAKLHRHPIPRLLGAAVLLLALGAVACDASDREAAFQEATERLADARQAVEERRERVNAAQAEVEDAQKRLSDALDELGEVEDDLAEAQAQVGLYATDDVLFREIQKRLLDDRQLQELAIAARVQKGMVVLTGEAANAEQRERASAIAESVPGVLGVENRITVAVSAEGV